MPGPDPEVAVQGNGRLAAERERPLSSALADHAGRVVLEVDVVHPEADQLGPAGARVEQQHVHGGVPAGLEVLAGAGREQLPQRVIGKDGDGLLGDGGGFILAVGAAVISPSSSSQA
jgi:hypothetical protein